MTGRKLISLGRRLLLVAMLAAAGFGYFGADRIMAHMDAKDQTGAARPIAKLLASLPDEIAGKFPSPAPDVDLLPPIPTKETEAPKPLPRTKAPCVWKAGVRMCDGVPAGAARGETGQ